MHQRQLIQTLSRESGIPQARVRETVDHFLAAMAEALKAGDEVEVPDFGRFLLESQEPRWVRPPGRGEKMAVPGRRRLAFEPHRELKSQLDATFPEG